MRAERPACWLASPQNVELECDAQTREEAAESMQLRHLAKRKETAECRQETALKNPTAFSRSSLRRRPWSDGGVKREAQSFRLTFIYLFLYFPRIWKLALPSYEIRCSDAGSFISKLALRFPLGTAAELLALISPSRLCDALRRRRNSLF